MSYVPHYSVRLEGTYGAPGAELEIWSTGFQAGFLGPGPALTGPLETSTLLALQAAATTFIGAAATRIDNVARWTQGKVTEIGVNGLATAPPQFFSPATPVAGGGASGSRHPLQVSTVVSLIGQQEVHRRMGRMYLPYTRAEINSNTAGMEIADRNGILAATGAFLDDCDQAFKLTDPELHLVIAGKDRVDGSPAFNSLLQTIRVGNILDTQRRRRNSLVEQYGLYNITS